MINFSAESPATSPGWCRNGALDRNAVNQGDQRRHGRHRGKQRELDGTRPHPGRAAEHRRDVDAAWMASRRFYDVLDDCHHG